MVRVAALGACVLLASYFLVVAARLRTRARVLKRLETASGAAAPRTPRRGVLSATRGRFEKSAAGTRLKRQLVESGAPLSWDMFLTLWSWSLLFVPALALLCAPTPLAIPPALLAAAFIPPRLVKSLKGRAGVKLEKQVEDFSADLSLYLRCGVPVDSAVALCSQDATAPLSGYLKEPLAMMAVGSVEEALDSLASSLDSADMKLIVKAVVASRQTGSDVRTIMAAVGESLRDRSAIKRELSTQTVQARLSGKVVAALPLLFLALSAAVSRGSLGVLFGTVPGIIMLCVAAALELLGFLWIRKILDIDV